ncbi:hypothetical protein V1639_08680 [Pseudarthrobacter sp. J75]|uniref:hypothetical protein n=1 Tax=unclassified Pseudarthrobacter TaxID=2647000 RepID=UPI002E80313F|nr:MULTISPECIES: hypothetical protein [unclassified Pseudarthrobacter]MEE2522553.1 hypothetical protein [Pseudarthrobacter sp. J47]MEE2529103.1 hypothetical protein [Pseudarthrobacter sp. J75]
MSRPRRVVLGTTAIFVGAAASLACLAAILTTTLGFSTHPIAVLFATLLYGCIPAVVLAFVCGAPLAILLHPVRNQWIHVLAFAGWGPSWVSRLWHSSGSAQGKIQVFWRSSQQPSWVSPQQWAA